MDYTSFYDILGKIDGIKYIKLVNEGDELKEVHILANTLRSPKQIVRDIESILLAVFDYRIDRKIISIAQIDMEEQKSIGRIKYDGIIVETSSDQITYTVKLSTNEGQFTAMQRCMNSNLQKLRTVASATLKAVEEMIQKVFILEVQDVVISSIGTITIINVLVHVVGRSGEELVVGAVVEQGDRSESVVKATLDAINRKINNL